MKFVKTLLAAAVMATATMAVAQPKCAHKSDVGLKSVTNPVRVAKATTTVDSTKSSKKAGVR